MFKFLTLLCTVLFSSSLFSQILKDNKIYENNDMSISTSGYGTFTTFSDDSWFDDTTRLAINFDLLYDSYAIRTQVISGNVNNINRITIEKNLPLFDNEVLIKIGRFPRLISFYNNLTDSPSNYEIAMVPMAVYNRRLISSQSFNAIDGIGLVYTSSEPEVSSNMLKLYFNYGFSPIDDQCVIQKEYNFGRCVNGYKFISDSNDYDIGISYEYKNLMFILSNTNVQFKTRLIDPKDLESSFIVQKTNTLTANVSKIGIKYDNNKYLIQCEYSVHKYSATNNLNITDVIHRENNYYILLKYNWVDNFSTNFQQSQVSSNYIGKHKDQSIGMTYVYDNITFSLDYHVGTGKEWKKHLSGKPDWKSTVLTVSYTF